MEKIEFFLPGDHWERVTSRFSAVKTNCNTQKKMKKNRKSELNKHTATMEFSVSVLKLSILANAILPLCLHYADVFAVLYFSIGNLTIQRILYMCMVFCVAKCPRLNCNAMKWIFTFNGTNCIGTQTIQFDTHQHILYEFYARSHSSHFENENAALS